MTAADGKIKIVFRGVRGSYPVPGPTTLRFGGNTTCQEVWAGGRLLIFDAGTGIISLGQELAQTGRKHTLALFFSHNHHDHTAGILYFKPSFFPDTTLHIFGPEDEPGSIMDALERLSAPVVHPVQFSHMGMNYTCDILRNGSVVRWSPGDSQPREVRPESRLTPEDVVVRTYQNMNHPLGGVLNFRLEYAGKSYVYATDVEGNEKNGDPGLAQFAQNADLLAHDGQYTERDYLTRRGWGHSTVAMAVKTATMAHVRRLAVIHHEPTYDDDTLEAMEREGQQAFPDLFFAREGQSVEL